MLNIKKYFLKIYDEVLEIEELGSVENNLFNKLESELNRVLLNQFVNSCDSETLKKYENLLQIIPNSSLEINFRRDRVLNRLAMNSAFTLRFLKDKLNDLIGVGNYNIVIDYEKHIIYVESVSLNQEWFNETYITINKIKPANMIFINKPKIDYKIISNEEVSYSQREYNYRLGTRWKLGAKAFKSLNPKGVLKMKEGKSITEEFLNNLRGQALEKIDHIKINDSLDIDTFITKEIQDKNIIIEYAVLKSDVSKEVRKVELMDINNKILTTINIYVPVIEDLEMKHVLKIEEGMNINVV